MANNVYCANIATGGATGSLDSIDGAGLTDGDVAFLIDASNTVTAVYTLNSTLGGAASPPMSVAPTSNAGDKRWELTSLDVNAKVTLYDGTNVALIQLISDVLELYTQKASGVFRVSVTSSGAAKHTALVATGSGSVDLYHNNSKKLETTATGATVTGALHETVPAFSRKNFIINGAFKVWQRGTSFASAANGQISADRFVYQKSGTMVHTLSLSSDAPTIVQAGRKFGGSLLIDCTTADAAIAAGDYTFLRYRLEGYDVLPLMGNTVTLSFWVRGTKTGIHCVGFRNSGADLSYVAEYTINSANTWEYKTITIQMPDGSAGTWDYTTGIGLQIAWVLACGSTYETAAGSWAAGNYFVTANQVNATDSTDNNFYLTGVQLELGSVATPFEFRPFGEELALCQRYFEKSYPLATVPGTAPNLEGCQLRLATRNSGLQESGFVFSVRKRTTPTVVLYGTTGGTINTITQGAADVAAAAAYIGETGVGLINNITGGSTAENVFWHWTADAEL